MLEASLHDNCCQIDINSLTVTKWLLSKQATSEANGFFSSSRLFFLNAVWPKVSQ